MAKSKKIEAQEEAPQAGGVEEITIGGSTEQEDLDTLLGDLESELSATAIIVGGDMPVPVANVLIQDLQALDAELDNLSQEQTLEVGDGISAEDQAALDDLKLKAAASAELLEQFSSTPEEAPAAVAADADAKKAPPATKRINTMGMKKSEALVKSLGSKVNDYLTLNLADIALPEAEQQAKREALLAAIDVLPIKIGEKVVNLYAHIANGANLSNYTKIAIYLLVKDGELSSKTLKDAYMARPYTEGTANSQATQMMKLLPTLGLATRNAGKLIVNPDSVLLPSIQA